MSKKDDKYTWAALGLILAFVFLAGVWVGIIANGSMWENRVVDNYTLIEAIRERVAAERKEDELR